MPRPVMLVLLVDALGWEIAEHFAFEAGDMPVRRPLGTVLGYSSAAIPSLLTGARPDQHGAWSMFRRARDRGSFHYLRGIPPLPHALDWRVRRLVRRWTDRRGGVAAYYDLYEIPVHVLHRFDVAQKGSPFDPGGLDRESVFDWMLRAGLRYRLWDYRTPEGANLESARAELSRGAYDVLFVYTAELDALMHRAGIFHPSVGERLGVYARFLDDMRGTARSAGVALRIVILSDHGMTDVHSTLDVWGGLEARGPRLGRDYLAFFDSTMVRLWGGAGAVSAAAETFGARGRLLPDEELEALGCRFPGGEYGDAIFLAEPGVLIVPSFMGSRAIAAMHGYHPADRYSLGCFLTDVEGVPSPASILGFKAFFQAALEGLR